MHYCSILTGLNQSSEALASDIVNIAKPNFFQRTCANLLHIYATVHTLHDASKKRQMCTWAAVVTASATLDAPDEEAEPAAASACSDTEMVGRESQNIAQVPPCA